MTRFKHALIIALLCLCHILTTSPTQAADNPNTKRRKAAEAALTLLDRHLRGNGLDYEFNESAYCTALSTAGLAFIGSGSTTSDGPYAASIRKCIDHIAQKEKEMVEGYQPVWGLSANLIFLCEAHRTDSGRMKPRISKIINSHCNYLLKAQTKNGAWCHTIENVPNQLGYRDFVAISAYALQGLGMAKREGVSIPNKCFEKGTEYLVKSSENGQIGYSPNKGQKGMAGPGRTAGGILALLAIGQQNHPLARSALNYLKANYVTKTPLDRRQDLNAGHASAQLGVMWAAWAAQESGTSSAFWNAQLGAILKRQKADGSFKTAPTDGRNTEEKAEAGDMATAMHALALVLPEGKLRIAKKGGSSTTSSNAKASATDVAKNITSKAEELGEDAKQLCESLSTLLAADKPDERKIKKELNTLPRAIFGSTLSVENKAQLIITLAGGNPDASYTYNKTSKRLDLVLQTQPCAISGLSLSYVIAPDGPISAIPNKRSCSLRNKSTKSTIRVPFTSTKTEPPETLKLILTWKYRKDSVSTFISATLTEQP